MRRRTPQLVLALLNVGLAFWVGHAAAYELFVSEPGIHFARVSFSSPMRFQANTPTLCAGVLLLGALLALAGATAIVATVTVGRPSAKTKPYWIVQGVALAAAAIAWLVATLDFLGQAGQFG